ncbi:glycosyltransferase family 8 protein [Staphylococcus simulans]|uniref:glycosyltransferase family 8 protein n=1 Tax=Staphylococcus simulans TaxID=1286 RepID=UPI000D03B26D|nr:glycosyltransferase family 8 protein [Staphylococcus simulans]
MHEKVDILVTLNENYLKPLKVMLLSLHDTNPHLSFKVWLVHEKITQSKLMQLEELLSSFNMELEEVKVPPNYFGNAKTVERYPQEMYFRLACGELLPESVTKVLYLDPDILVINTIDDLWNLNLERNIFAAATHEGFTKFSQGMNNLRLGTKQGQVYFNSGVMLIDVEKARQEISMDDIFNFIEKNNQYLLLPDQDVMNSLYGDKIKEIPEEIWNYDTRQANMYYTKSVGEYDTHWVAYHTVFLHFCGRPKPWDNKSNSRFTMLYLQYQKRLEQLENLND